MPADPLDPLPALSTRVGNVDRRRPGRRRDVRGRGIRHPQPLGARAPHGRRHALVAAVANAVDRLAGLQAPGLTHVTARVHRIPAQLEERLALLQAGAETDEEGLFAQAERWGPDGVMLTLFERPLSEVTEAEDLEEAVYAVALSRVAAALGMTPQMLDPSWGRG